MMRLGSTLLSVALWAGCAASPKSVADPKALSAEEEQVVAQASLELGCDRTQLQMMKLSNDGDMMGVKNHTFSVRGCGKQVTYKTSCGWGQCSVFNLAQVQSVTPKRM
jgi:uncharacterized lipoprotein YajG